MFVASFLLYWFPWYYCLPFFACVGFFGMPINGLGPEMSCELLFPIAEATAIGSMGSDNYMGSVYAAILANILEG